ncbi:20389_t:CDS:1, partial [Racocetra persica]
NEKYVSRSILYQIKDNEDAFRDHQAESFETLIDDFNKNSLNVIT